MTGPRIAGVAALVSAGSATAWLRIARRTPPPRLHVEGTSSVDDDSKGDRRFAVDIRNAGTVSVVVTAAGLEFRDGHRRALLDLTTPGGRRALPATLQPGDGITLTTPLDPVRDADRQRGITAVFVATAAGDQFSGRQRADLRVLA